MFFISRHFYKKRLKRGRNYLIEIKDGSKPPSKRKLTSDEQEWHDTWRGTVYVANNMWPTTLMKH
jgi:hypothetical protein